MLKLPASNFEVKIKRIGFFFLFFFFLLFFFFSFFLFFFFSFFLFFFFSFFLFFFFSFFLFFFFSVFLSLLFFFPIPFLTSLQQVVPTVEKLPEPLKLVVWLPWLPLLPTALLFSNLISKPTCKWLAKGILLSSFSSPLPSPSPFSPSSFSFSP